MKKRLKYLLIVIPVLIIGIIAFQVGRRVLGSKGEEQIVVATPVIVDYPKEGTIENSLLYPGNLLPEQSIGVVSKVGGKVDSVFVSEGDRVVQGQTLISIEKDVVRLQMEQARAGYQAASAQYRKAVKGVREKELTNAKASLEQAEKDIEIARTNLERSRRLLDAGTISRSTYEEAENSFESAKMKLENAGRNVSLMEEGASEEELEIARANAEAMKAQFELAQLQFENSDITSPGTGIVARVMAEEGNMVGTTTPLLIIVQDDPLYADVPVPEKYFGLIAEKREQIEARVFPIAYPENLPFSGMVTGVDTVIDAASRTFTVEIAVVNSEKSLRPGMYVNVELILQKSERAVMVPESALVIRDDETVVFIVDEGDSFHARLRPVTVGLRKEGLVEIKEGLSLSDLVIVRGNAFLEDGQVVEFIK
jgi:HlyD family secretion protein